MEYILVGIMIGFLSGIFGIGGSIIATPVLKTLFGLPDFIALASPLPVTIPTALAGAFGYCQKGIIHKKTAFFTILGGLPATLLGAFATKFVKGEWMMILTGFVVFIVALRLLKGNKVVNCDTQNKIPFPVLAGIIGFVAGIFSGFLAVGGGIILIPAFILTMGLSMQEAASTSLLCVAFFAIPGTLVHWHLGHIDWHLVLYLSCGVIPASYLGARIGMSVKSKQLQIAFSIFLIIFSIYFIMKQINI